MRPFRYILIIIVNIIVLQGKEKSKAKQGLSPSDPTSFSRPEQCVVTNIDLSLDLDFTNQIARGKVDLKVKKQNSSVKKLILDSLGLRLLAVEQLHEGKATSLHYKLGREIVPGLGSNLSICLPKTNEAVLTIRIKYETSPEASGLKWLTANQTLDKKMPYVFSQFQPIHARSFLPCQDTPAVKTPYTAEISAPKGITVLMSGIRVGEPVALPHNRIRYKFEQKIPIPSYLIAIAAGNLVSRKLGPRSHVWAEPSLIGKAAYEFAETEKILKVSENICGPYIWGIYDVIVVPSSFPISGMENPCLTFLSPRLIEGDRSEVLVVAHEIAHSWTGNLVTNINFDHYWLNEGFTTFMERKIWGRLKGHEEQDFEAILGLNGLENEIEGQGAQNKFTKLVVDLRGAHPDEAFSTVPYEKGSLFLRYLENLVGGPEKFEAFLRYYFNKYKYKSIDSNEFKNCFMGWFHKKGTTKIKEIDWNRWLYSPGMPPVIPKYDTTLANVSVALKDKWARWDCEKQNVFSPNDLKNMTTKQKSYFLQLILNLDPMPLCKLREMEKLYKWNCYKQNSIRLNWISIGLYARWMPRVDDALKFLSETGDMSVIGLYGDLYGWEKVREKAIDAFKKNRPNMFHITATPIKQELNLPA